MNLWRILAIASIITAITSTVYADIHIYEVVTKKRRFQTASKMLPKSFLKYYGGSDVIYELSVVDTIKGDNFDEAIKKFKLGRNNYRDLSPKAVKRPTGYPRHIWWR